MDDDVPKPIDPDSLAAVLEKYGEVINEVESVNVESNFERVEAAPEVNEVDSSSPKLDLKEIEERTGIDDVALLVTVANALAEEGPLRVSEIERGLRENNAELIHISAHTLKGASRAMAMTEVADLAETVELAGRDGRLNEVPPILEKLKERVDQMVNALNAFAVENS